MSRDEALDAAKAAARKAAAGRRIGQNLALGDRLAAHLLRENLVPPGAIVAGFWPIQDEIDIRPLLAALHARGHPLALPVTGRRGEALAFRAWAPGEPLLPGRFGTSHPAGAAVTPDVLLIPLLAFALAMAAVSTTGRLRTCPPRSGSAAPSRCRNWTACRSAHTTRGCTRSSPRPA
jgi:5-formyltetrahydrofolate cyclo-ligase